MIDLAKFYSSLKLNSVQFIAGVPDTLLNDFCLGLSSFWPSDKHVIAANEGNAIAMASGYYLATGSVPLVYMQNSGLGNALNPLISLVDSCVYSIPLVLLIGWRGEPGTDDWPQHQRQGELTPVLLENLGIKYRVLQDDEESAQSHVGWATQTALHDQKPTALLVPKGVLAKKKKESSVFQDSPFSLSREDAIKIILCNSQPGSLFVASTGRMTRELYAVRDLLKQSHHTDFLNVGAMGHTLSIAAGIATARPDKKVYCLDGDASALMHMGSLPVTANLNLSNLVHIVLNNGVHESVGGQPSVGHTMSFSRIATIFGYEAPDKYIHSSQELISALQHQKTSSKSAFIEVRIKKGMRSDMPILRMSPHSQKDLFMADL